jgi:Sortilin, neurotensin receptor 3,
MPRMLSEDARPMRRIAFLLLILVSALPAVAARRRAVEKPTPHPRCSMITGTAGVTFTHDFGETLAPSAQSLQPIAYTFGLAVMTDDPGTLMAWHKDDLLISTDAGCSWRVVATIPDWDFPPRLTPARGGRMFAWSDNRRFLVRYDARGVHRLKPPVDFIGFVAHEYNGEHLRAGGNDGSIWESADAGDTWVKIGELITPSPLYYRIAFDPQNISHIVAGTVSTGAHVSVDGGRTWTRSTMTAKNANIFEVVFSPSDSSRVWIEGIDLGEGRRHIWVSNDGGASFEPVVHEGGEVELTNGNLMVAHPTNKDILFFEFGTHLFGHGTNLYRFDLKSGRLSIAHNSHDGVNAIAFSRMEPNLMYLGLEAID